MKLTYFKALILLLSLVPLITVAQDNQQKKSDSLFNLVKKYIDEKNVNLIYSLTSKEFKATATENDLQAFFEKQIYPLGQVRSASFISARDNLYKYKLVFEKNSLAFSFSVDQDNKLVNPLFSPFVLVTGPVLSSNPLKSKLDKKLDSMVMPFMKRPDAVGLSIGIIKEGKTYTYGYGTTQKEKEQLPDANTIFEIGSITKTFTSAVLAYYVNKGKVSLTDPITKYLPDSLAVNRELQKVSIVNLSNHTSGLPRLPGNFFNKNTDSLNPYKNYTPQLFFSSLKKCKLDAVPGTVYAYSNTAPGLLALILERISGKTYETLVKEIITGPLEMKSTFQHLTPELSKRFVKVYGLNAIETKAWDFDALAGCGALKSTVNDLLTYAKNNMESGVPDLSAAFNLSHEVTFLKEPAVGLGWHLLQRAGELYYWHNGGTGGSRSFLAFNIKKKTAIVLLANSVDEITDFAFENLPKLLE